MASAARNPIYPTAGTRHHHGQDAAPYHVEVDYYIGGRKVRSEVADTADSIKDAKKYFDRAIRLAFEYPEIGQDEVHVHLFDRGQQIKFKEVRKNPTGCAQHNPTKCRACGGTKSAPKNVQCSACRRAGFVSRACIHCGGLGSEVCRDSYHVGAKKNPQHKWQGSGDFQKLVWPHVGIGEIERGLIPTSASGFHLVGRVRYQATGAGLFKDGPTKSFNDPDARGKARAWVERVLSEWNNRGIEKNPLFDRYTVRTVGGDGVSEKVENILTLSGAERRVKTLAKKYPCLPIEIVSKNFNRVVKSFKPSGGNAAPRVDEDNSREYKHEAKEAQRFDVVVGRELFATYDTRREAEKVAKREGGKVREVKMNPVKTIKLSESQRSALEVAGHPAAYMRSMPVATRDSAGKLEYSFGGGIWGKSLNEAIRLYGKTKNPLTGHPSHDIPTLIHEGYPQKQAVAIGLSEQRRRANNPAAWMDPRELTLARAIAKKSPGFLREGKTEYVNGIEQTPFYFRGSNQAEWFARDVQNSVHHRHITEIVTGRRNPSDASQSKRRNPESSYASDGNTYTVLLYDNKRLVSTDKYDNRREAEESAKDWRLMGKGATATVKVSKGKKRNPDDTESAAAHLFEDFHGVPATEILDYEETHEMPDAYAALGDLVELWVMPIHSRSAKSVKIVAPDPDKASLADVVKLASNPEGNQLYFIGGDQCLDLEALGFSDSEHKPHMTIGVITELTYRTKKKFHKLRLIDYFHKLGEETGHEPFLTYDVNAQRMGVSGGAYHVKPEGIIN